MSPRDHDYDEYVPRRGAGLSAGVILAVVAGALLLLGGLGFVAVMLFWGVAAPEADDEAQPVVVTDAPPKTVYDRAEFREMLIGKTPDEVVALVGRPDRTQEDETGVRWYYNRRTKDPADGRIDRHAQVVFRDGKVSAVNH